MIREELQQLTENSQSLSETYTFFIHILCRCILTQVELESDISIPREKFRNTLRFLELPPINSASHSSASGFDAVPHPNICYRLV